MSSFLVLEHNRFVVQIGRQGLHAQTRLFPDAMGSEVIRLECRQMRQRSRGSRRLLTHPLQFRIVGSQDRTQDFVKLPPWADLDGKRLVTREDEPNQDPPFDSDFLAGEDQAVLRLVDRLQMIARSK